MAGRETAGWFGLDIEESRPLARLPELTPPCRRRDGDMEFEGGMDFTSFLLPGRTASARLASRAWGRELSTAGRTLGWSALRASLPMRSRSTVPIWRRATSWAWSWSRRMTDKARLWAEK